MSNFQDMQSASPSADLSNVNSQPLSPGLNGQDMEFSCSNKEESSLQPREQPVSKMEISSSGWNVKKIQKSYVCDICEISCSRRNNLKQHKLTHSGEKPFNCNVCEMPFARISDLKRHRLSHLKKPTQHKCDKCIETFLRKCDLMKHRKIHSKTPKMYKCEQCSVVFSRKYDYLRHGTTHKSKKQHKCEQCSEVYSRKFDLLKHSKIHSKPRTEYNCDHCSKLFLRKSDFLNHAKTHKPPKKHKCAECSEVYNTKSALIRHIRTLHTAKSKHTDSSIKAALYEKVKHFSRQNALGVFTKTKITTNEENEQDFIKFFESIRCDVFNELTYQIEEKKRFKWYAVVQARLTRITEDGVTETATPHFHSKTTLQLTDHSLPSTIEEAFSKITRSFEEFTNRGSGWTLERILYLELSIAKY